MISIDTLHISLNRILLLSVGLWPYQQSKLVQVQLILLIGILITFIIFQFATLITSRCTPDLFINVLSSATFYITLIIKYHSFKINIKVVRCLLEELQHTYNELQDENEITFIKAYGKNAQRYTVVFTICGIFIGFIVFSQPFWPRVLNIISSVNESRPHSLQFRSKYFLDEKKYFYWIFLHANVALAIGGFAMLATATILLAFQQYACGMFRIASYRIEHAMTINTLQKNKITNENLIYEGLIYAVDIHRKAMKFSDSSIARFKIMFMLLIIVGVISVSLNFFQVYQIILVGYDVEILMMPVLFLSIHISYVFIGNYIAQEIMDHNNQVFITVYNVRWYTAPLRIQKMILFLLQRNTKTFNLNIGGLIVGSLEGAATILSMCISYFTVLYSTQK